MQFEHIDWTHWQPDEYATLLFVLRDDQVLLIRKKRGLGAGKINGPGGKLEPDETAMACAIRETQEELGVTALSPVLYGRHKFQFADGYALQVFVYATTSFNGEAIETDEAIPLWTPIDAIPYDEMWQDDRIWLPKMLNGEFFDGRYLFDNDIMLGYELDDLDHTRDLDRLD